MQAATGASLPYKLPRSVLVIIHTADLQVLLLRRVSQMEGQDYWQPVTGSQDSDSESWQETAIRTEHVFSLQVPSYTKIVLSPREHTAHAWHDWQEAAQRCYSISNSEAILWLPRFIAS